MAPIPLLAAYPIVGAGIGWLSVKAAIRLIFRPIHPFNIFGLTIHGVIPRHQASLGRNLGRAVNRELSEGKVLGDLIGKVDWEGETSRLLDKMVDEELGAGSLSHLPFVGNLLSGFLARSKETIKNRIAFRMLENRHEIAGRLLQGLDIEHLTARKVAAVDPAAVEKAAYRLLKPHFLFMSATGAAIGFALGLLTSLIGLLA